MKGEFLPKQLLSLKSKTSWSWEKMAREFHRVMGADGPSHTTLLRYAIGDVQRRNVVTERYVQEAIHKVKVELVQKKPRESKTHRNSAEKELGRTEVRFRELVENAKDLIFRYRLVAPEGFEYISPVVQDMLGYSPEEFYADPLLVLTLLHPDDRHKLEKGFRGEGPLRERATLRWVHKDGRAVWTEETKVPIYDEAGNLVAIEGISRDITERMRVEKA